MAAYNGKLGEKEPVGEYDLYLMLADRYGWRPEDVNRMDPALIDELRAKMRAERILAEERRRAAERKRKHDEWVRTHRRPQGEGVDISEIN